MRARLALEYPTRPRCREAAAVVRAAVLRSTSLALKSRRAQAFAAATARDTRCRAHAPNERLVKLRSSATPCDGFRAVQVRPLSFATVVRSCRNRAAVGPRSNPLFEHTKGTNTRRDPPWLLRTDCTAKTHEGGDTPVVEEVCVLVCVSPVR